MTFARGLDISIYQPNIDWPTVIAATGISFVLIRTSDGTYADAIFAKHWAEAKAAGLLRGAYHFLRQSADPQQQAGLYLQALGADLGELPPILDIEDTRVTSPAAYAAAAQAWLNTVGGQTQRQPMIYTGAWWWNPNMLIAGRYPDWAPGYPLWVASYPLRSTVPTAAQIDQSQFTPIMPKSWTSWMFWQYSGDVATLNGVTDANGNQTHVDLDVFNGTLDQLKTLAQGPAPVAHSGTGTVSSTPPATPPLATTTTPPATTTNPPVTPPAATTPPATPPVGVPLPDARVTNQVMINAFSHAFGAEYWQVVLRAGLASLADMRQATYSGPAIQALINLTSDEQTQLEAELEQILARG